MKQSQILAVVCSCLFSLLIGINSQAQAVTLYDEGMSGDLPIPPGQPLGMLASPAISSVIGGLPGGGDIDEFIFMIGPGSQLSSIILVDWSTTFTSTNFSMLLDGVVKSPGNPSNIGVDILTTFWSSPLGPGIHTFRLLTGTFVISNYQLDFVTTSTISTVPEPSTKLLMGSGLLGLVGWQYRKKRLE